ncbi:oxytocin-neurophysin 1-like [Cylas formicarius]|uniref:oxytocin-neurophysin 1-like n=1 Tax=Cylas formicarius TaxID=197179 RepID=UPI0029584C28|nr:oxytocin-neurophysin 1-like [Cylas formicarius]
MHSGAIYDTPAIRFHRETSRMVRNDRESFPKTRACIFMLVLSDVLVNGCLITNCNKGGKRSGKFDLAEGFKSCVSCGPNNAGKCFGPMVCCGPFGCLIGTPESLKCQREGQFHEKEPCVAGFANCRKNTGRCATDGVCCSQESCHIDKQCSLVEDKRILLDANALDLYGFYMNEAVV